MAHNHGGGRTGRHLRLSIILTLAFVFAEMVAGWIANSLALLSDAGHNFADALALILSWYAHWMSKRPADARRTFGYHRAGVLAALVNAVSLVVIALFIFWEALQRLRSPEAVQSGLMIGVALMAVFLNGLISFWLHADAKHDLNIRSAYLHMLGDALAAIGIIVAGALIALTGQTVADPLVSMLIGGLIVWSSWGILVETVDVLMEAVPKGMDIPKLVQAIVNVPGVRTVHDLHVWAVSSGLAACSCHIVVGEQSVRDSQRVQQAVAEMLEHDFRIAHTTIQVEVEECCVSDIHCQMESSEDSQEEHHH